MKKILIPFFYFLLSSALLLLSFFRNNYYLDYLDGSTSQPRFGVFLILLSFFGLYGIILFTKERYKLRYFLLSLILLAIAFPILSRDIFCYLVPASNWIYFHQNPYMVLAANNPANPWFSLVTPIRWFQFPFLYGPIFLIIAALPMLLKIHILWEAVYFYKLIVIVCYIFLIWIIKAWKSNEKDKFTVLLWAMNPAVLVHVLLDGHNDIFTITFLVLSVIMLSKKKFAIGLVLFLASSMVKLYTFIFLPIFWFKDEKLNLKRIIVSCMTTLASLIFFIKIAGFNITSFYHVLTIYSDWCLYRCAPFVTFLRFTFPRHVGVIEIIAFIPVYFITFYLFLYRNYQPLKFVCWAFLALLFIAVSTISPWYLLIVILFALLTKERNYYILVYIATFYSLMHFFII